ncbi:MAG: MurR/RpiR family transcriptional regulator [Oscillospiraceae bacterium]
MRYIESVPDKIKNNYDDLFAAEKKIADYILCNYEKIVSMNVSELAELSGASDATVIRFCKHLGYKGYYNMKLQLAQDLGRDQLLGNGECSEQIDTIEDLLKKQAQNILSMSANLNADAIEKCVHMLLTCERVHLVAAGNTIPTASDFEFRLGHVGIRTSSPLMPEHQLNAINLGSEKDIVIGISHMGSSHSVITAFELARRRNIKTIAITDMKMSPLAQIADVTITTGVENSGLSVFGAESHIYLMAALDALLFRVAKCTAKGDTRLSDIEILLSETKL